MPAASGSSILHTLRSIFFPSANRASFSNSIAFIGTFSPTRRVPPFPGAIYSLPMRGDCESFQASACSLPPPPTNKTSMRFIVRYWRATEYQPDAAQPQFCSEGFVMARKTNVCVRVIGVTEYRVQTWGWAACFIPTSRLHPLQYRPRREIRSPPPRSRPRILASSSPCRTHCDTSYILKNTRLSNVEHAHMASHNRRRPRRMGAMCARILPLASRYSIEPLFVRKMLETHLCITRTSIVGAWLSRCASLKITRLWRGRVLTHIETFSGRSAQQCPDRCAGITLPYNVAMLPDDPIERHFRFAPAQHVALRRLKLATIRDLLYHFPSRYEAAGASGEAARLVPGAKVTLVGSLSKLKARKLWKSRRNVTEGWF